MFILALCGLMFVIAKGGGKKHYEQNTEVAPRRFCCINGHEWDVPFEVMVTAPPRFCPTCNTLNILPTQPFGFGWGRKGWARHKGS